MIALITAWFTDRAKRPCHIHLSAYISPSFSVAMSSLYQDGRVVKALDLSSNGRVVHVGSKPTPGI